MSRTLPRVLSLFLLCCFTLAGRAADLPPGVAKALAAAGVPATNVGLVIQNLDADTPLVAYGEHRSFNPASVMKLLTTFDALDTLGPAYTFKTRVWVDGEVRDGVLKGDLFLQGGGDPDLTMERLWLMLREIRLRGIRQIRGDVVLDESYYDLDPSDPGDFDQSPLQPYNAPPSALMVNFNALALHLAPADGKLNAVLDPPVYAVRNDASLDPAGVCGDWEDGIKTVREDGTLHLTGSYPAACGDRILWVNLLSPPDNTAAQFVSLWRESGGVFTGRSRLGTVPESARLWLEFDSPPLAEIVRKTNKFSNNVMAKMLFLDLGAIRSGAPATWAKGEAAIRAWLKESGLVMPKLVVQNGSGLSRIARISAASLVELLRYAARRPCFHEFVASLPDLGLDGTLKKRLTDSPYAGWAHLKTGTLDGASNLAGYVMDGQGRERILVFLINHPQAEHAEEAQDAAISSALASDPMSAPSGP